MSRPEDTGGKKPLITYPVAYPFKVMGLQAEGFRAYALELFEKLMGATIPPEAVSEQLSPGNKYLSLTLTVELTSEAQRKDIYEQLHKEKRIVYYL